MVIEFVVPPQADGARLGVFLRRSGVSLSQLRSLKALENSILLNGHSARADCIVHHGDIAVLELPPEEGYSVRPQAIPLHIVYSSRHALVVNKPPGMVAHPGPSHFGGTLANAFCGMMAAQGMAGVYRPVGRLDGDTSGLALLAMNSLATPILASSSVKVYVAIAGGRMATGTGKVAHPLAPAKGSAIRQQVSADGRPSHTEYRVLAATEKASVVLVRPRTGRTHQIRAHFAHIGHPLLGDKLYGGDISLLRRHALHCAGLEFTEPEGNQPRLFGPLPGDMAMAVSVLGFGLVPVREGLFSGW